MDAFENIIAAILQRRGYWTMTSVKVNLTLEEKKKVKRPTTPRWEIDVVAYRGKDNHILVVECKSFLDSAGVDPRAFDGTRQKAEGRYKLFCDTALRDVVLSRLKTELVLAGFCRPNPKITLCLAAGNVHGEVDGLRELFKERDWKLIGPDEIRKELAALADTGYENSVASVVAKLLLRRTKGKKAVDANLVADV